MSGHVVIVHEEQRVLIMVDGVQVASANHDEHGWAGMEAVVETAKGIASAASLPLDEEEQMPLTHPRSPIHIGGVPYDTWREAGPAHLRAGSLSVTVDNDGANTCLAKLGQYVPGLLEDGTAVEYYIVSVQRISDDAAEVTVIPSVRDAWGDLL